MTQQFENIPADKTLRDSRPIILSRDEALISNFAGESFPVENIAQGMLCYRTDENKIYLLTNIEGPSWHLVFDLSKTPTNQERVNNEIKKIDGSIKNSISSLHAFIAAANEKIAALEADVAALKSKKLNIFAGDIEGVEITDKTPSDELSLIDGKLVNRKRTLSATEPPNPRDGDWWIQLD